MSLFLSFLLSAAYAWVGVQAVRRYKLGREDMQVMTRDYPTVPHNYHILPHITVVDNTRVSCLPKVPFLRAVSEIPAMSWTSTLLCAFKLGKIQVFMREVEINFQNLKLHFSVRCHFIQLICSTCYTKP